MTQKDDILMVSSAISMKEALDNVMNQTKSRMITEAFQRLLDNTLPELPKGWSLVYINKHVSGHYGVAIECEDGHDNHVSVYADSVPKAVENALKQIKE